MESRYLTLLSRAKKEYPRLSVRMRNRAWLDSVLKFLAKLTKRDYSTFTTTIGSSIYTADDWETRDSDRKYRTLRHELEHVRQFHCWPLGRWAWPINHVLMGIAYLLVLPVLWTFRAKFEREGYTQTLLVHYELYGPFNEDQMESYAKWLEDTFGGSTYGWMWTRKKAYAWAMETMRKINAGEITARDGDRVDGSEAA